MALSRAMSSGVSGIQTHQTAMDVIGNNVSNVNTYAFKSSRTTFRDVYYQTISGASNASTAKGGSNPAQIGYGAQVGSIDVLNTRGNFTSTGRSMDCYIDGEGYFVVKDGGGNERLTQVGNFSFDGQGNLVDATGNFVCGYPVDYTIGQTLVGGATVNFGQANGNILDGYKLEVKYDTSASPKTAVAANSTDKTITVTLPKASATQKDLQNALQASSPAPAWTWTGTAPTGLDVSKITVQGVDTVASPAPAANSVIVSEGTGSIVPGDAHYKNVPPEKIVNTYGPLKNISMGSDGSITGEDANGVIRVIGQLALASVPNPDALTMDGNSYYKAVNNTGTVSYDHPGASNLGALKSGGLSGSNVDLATEFSNMIVTQRGFQANSKIITVSDEMLETLVNMKR